jgi:hypothetical protein
MFWEKVSVGLSHADGTISIAHMAPDREYIADPDNKDGVKLLIWIYQAVRGLDAAFSSDLKFDVTGPTRRLPRSPLLTLDT